MQADPNYAAEAQGASGDASGGAEAQGASCGASGGAEAQGAKGDASWHPSGALANPDPSIADLSMEQYMETDKSCFYRPAAKKPTMGQAFQCSAMEEDAKQEDAKQKKVCKFYQIPYNLPVLSVHVCIFICK